MAEQRSIPRWARWTAGACSVAVLGAAGYLLVDALPSSAATSGLRTATVDTGSVTQTTSLSGSVVRVDQVTAALRTSGTVRTVTVAVGDEVESGDVLATLDTAALKRAVTVAQANLVAAQASLDAAATSSTTTTSSTPTTSSTTTSAPATSTPTTPTASATRSPSPSPAPGVDATPVHRAVDGYDALVTAAVTTCQPVTGGGTTPGPDPRPTPSPTPTTSPTPSPSPTGSASASATPTPSGTPTAAPTAATVQPASRTTSAATTPTPEQVTACIQALSGALAAAQHTASGMDRLVTALDAATTALQQQQSQAATSGASGSGTGGTTSGSAATGSAGGTGAGATRSTASLEVAVLEATQELAAAQQDLDAAVLRAPIAGRVGRVDLVAGEPATAGSGVVVVGPGAAVVTVDLPLAQLSKVRVSQDVTVTPAGTTDELPALVQSIGVLPSSTTSSTPTYPVQVTVDDAPVSLAAGSTATATIVLATAEDVLTVPVSAVTGVSAGRGAVQVLSGTTVQAATVTVGAVGQGRVQVQEGLTAGQVVVLADPSTALPSSTFTRRSTTGGVSSLTGQGGPGGGTGGPPSG